MGAGVVVSQQLPNGQQLLIAAQDAFIFAAGSLVPAAATAVGAVLALLWLPARAREQEAIEPARSEV